MPRRSSETRRPKHITLRVSPREFAELRVLAKARGLNTSETIRAAVQESFARVAEGDR